MAAWPSRFTSTCSGVVMGPTMRVTLTIWKSVLVTTITGLCLAIRSHVFP
jgi:hypothetical protein